MSDLVKNFSKATAIKAIYIAEGGDKFTDDPTDRGGETRWGITKVVAHAPHVKTKLWAKHKWNGDMRTLPEGLAYDIYAMDFWDSLSLDRVMEYSTLLAYLLFNIGVNAHPVTAGRHLQRSLNIFNNRQKLYPDLVVDGKPGAVTIRALDAFLKARGRQGLQVLVNNINGLMTNYYTNIAEKDETQEKWSYGWAVRLFEALEHFKDEWM
jgi:lysozyme family protein